MKLTSTAFSDGDSIPQKYTCDSRDINPPLKWENPPDKTKSFALIVDDPDAPAGTWVHWLVCDISKEGRNIQEDSVPKGVTQVKNDFKKVDYGGPCPPGGTHRYFFKLHALDVKKLKRVNQNNFYDLVEKHSIEKAQLMGKYTRA